MSNFINYVFILGLTAVVIYIIVRLVQKGRQKNNASGNVNSNPPYEDVPSVAQTSQLMKLETTNGSGIANVSLNAKDDNKLRNFCIKASYNSAFTGSFVNLEMIKYVLTRGCRFLDFNVYFKDGIPIVSCTNSTNAVSLGGVFTTIVSNAFTDTSPNPGDPLFIQLHIENTLSNTPNGYDLIATAIESTIPSRLYKGAVTTQTNLSDLLGKIVLVVESTRDYQNCGSCARLKKLVNIESGNSNVKLFNEYDLLQQSYTPPDPSVYFIRIVSPNNGMLYGVVNPNFLNLAKNYGAQIVMQAFYINDTALTAYEDIFRQFKSAFVRISAFIST
jgi:hypothetical protein